MGTNNSNQERALWRTICRERLSKHIQRNIGVEIQPQDPYKWDVLPEKKHLFHKHLSKHCVGAYKEICSAIGVSFEAVPADAVLVEPCISESKYQVGAKRPFSSGDTGMNDNPKRIQPTKTTPSFTAKIDELTAQNSKLEAELEERKATALETESANRHLRTDKEAAQAVVKTLMGENQRVKEALRRSASVADFFREKAFGLEQSISEIIGVLEAVKDNCSTAYSRPEKIPEYGV